MMALQGYNINQIQQPDALALSEGQLADLAGNASAAWESEPQSGRQQTVLFA